MKVKTLANPKNIPSSPGVYLFRERAGAILYIGKALNLKKRLTSYFQKSTSLPDKTRMMLTEATRLETLPTASEIEALIKEAELIKKYRPKYNILMRDDKSYSYVGITKEMFPKIFITHEPTKNRKLLNQKKLARYVGPFTGAAVLYSTLKLLRRIFPYCTCRRPHARPCVNSQIGRCPGYCCATAAPGCQLPAAGKHRSEYRNNIRKIVAVLTGAHTKLLGTLKAELKRAAKAERYEKAARLRDQVGGLEKVFLHRSVMSERESGAFSWPEIQARVQALLKTDVQIHRVEGYDISNISGAEATGSMVVFTDGKPDKREYRKFRIKTVIGANDVAMHQEVIRRRFNHPEWSWPDIMVIDGGKSQLGAARKALAKFKVQNSKFKIPLVTALAKKEEVLFTEKSRAIYLKRQHPTILHLFQRIRDESHRFAKAYHHKLRKKSYAEA